MRGADIFLFGAMTSLLFRRDCRRRRKNLINVYDALLNVVFYVRGMYHFNIVDDHANDKLLS